ncbi:MAG: DUF697 domain-containing protein [Spirochaetes bacterium]|nr:DUF697 domain-containing protein [Spirochaetota bacterium]
MSRNKKREVAMEVNEGKNRNVETIIKNHIVYSMTAAMIPIPLVDITAVTAIQLDMIKQIASAHGVQFDQDAGKALVSSLAGATFARLCASAVKAIPGVGTIVGISTQVALSGASTYALGKIFDAHFAQRGSIFDLRVERVKSKYDELVEKGKDVVRSFVDERKAEDIFATIAKLKELKDAGAITEEDFEQTKQRLLEKIASA